MVVVVVGGVGVGGGGGVSMIRTYDVYKTLILDSFSLEIKHPNPNQTDKSRCEVCDFVALADFELCLRNGICSRHHHNAAVDKYRLN